MGILALIKLITVLLIGYNVLKHMGKVTIGWWEAVLDRFSSGGPARSSVSQEQVEELSKKLEALKGIHKTPPEVLDEIERLTSEDQSKIY